MHVETALAVIDGFLKTLKHTGVSGFEGLVTVLFQEAIGQEFRLSSSGRQSGRDSASESGYGNTIKVEAKHYRQTTPLNLRELISEIEEATSSDPSLDIWVLAASRSIDDQTERSLDAQAEKHGIEIVFLDSGSVGLPRLPVLIAAYPDLVIHWANTNHLPFDAHTIRSAMVSIAHAQEFEPVKIVC
jgi:hypothetical protein